MSRRVCGILAVALLATTASCTTQQISALLLLRFFSLVLRTASAHPPFDVEVVDQVCWVHRFAVRIARVHNCSGPEHAEVYNTTHMHAFRRHTTYE